MSETAPTPAPQGQDKVADPGSEAGTRLIERLRYRGWSHEDQSDAFAALEALQAENARLREALSNFTDGASHTRIFLVSREKMHPNGVTLYDQAVAFAHTALAEPGS